MIDHAVQSVKQNRPLLRFRQFSRFHRNELRNLCQQIKIHLLIRKDALFLLRGTPHQANNSDNLPSQPDGH